MQLSLCLASPDCNSEVDSLSFKNENKNKWNETYYFHICCCYIYANRSTLKLADHYIHICMHVMWINDVEVNCEKTYKNRNIRNLVDQAIRTKHSWQMKECEHNKAIRPE